jgi:hypothetical protein
MNASRLLLAIPLVGLLAAPAGADNAPTSIHSAGPRIGVVMPTNAATRQKLKDRNISPILTAFGWQFEYEYLNTDGGTTGLMEFVPMAVGLESGLALPSLNSMIGVRFTNGIELGFGPNVSLVETTKIANAGQPDQHSVSKDTVGVGMSGAIGITARSGKMNFPINLAGVRNQNGFRISLLAGWTL